MTTEIKFNLIKVRYIGANEAIRLKYLGVDDSLALSPREYTYWSERELAVGDIITVPVRDTTGRAARVSSINVPEAEIEAFRDKVKFIPADSAVAAKEPVSEPEPKKEEWVSTGPPVSNITTSSNTEAIMPTTALIAIQPNRDPRVQGLVNEVQNILTIAQKRTITEDADLEGAANDLALGKGLMKALTALKKEYVSPVKDHLDDIKSTFENVMMPLENAERITRNKIDAYRDAQAAKKAEVERINALRMEAATAEAKLSGTGEITESVNLIPEVPAPVTRVHTEAGTLGTMTIPKFEIVDFVALPNDYKLPDTAKIYKVVKATSGNIVIPGVKIWFENSTTIRTR